MNVRKYYKPSVVCLVGSVASALSHFYKARLVVVLSEHRFCSPSFLSLSFQSRMECFSDEGATCLPLIFCELTRGGERENQCSGVF